MRVESGCEVRNRECGMRNAEWGSQGEPFGAVHRHLLLSARPQARDASDPPARRLSAHSLFRVPYSAFRIPHSAFRIPHSAFRIPAFRIPHSLFPMIIELVLLLLFAPCDGSAPGPPARVHCRRSGLEGGRVRVKFSRVGCAHRARMFGTKSEIRSTEKWEKGKKGGRDKRRTPMACCW